MLSFILLVSTAGVFINHYYTALRKDELSHVSMSAREVVEDNYRIFRWSQREGAFLDVNADSLAKDLSEVTDEFANFVIVTDREGTIKCIDLSAQKLIATKIDANFLPTTSSGGELDGVGTLGVFEKEHYFHAVEIVYYGEYIATVFVCIPTSVVKQPIRAIIRLVAYVSFGVMCLALLASYQISKRITNPLAKMAAAAKAFAEGDFTVRVPVTGHDEVSEFGVIFNEMAESLERSEKTRNDFVANVSHDLRSPMTSITGFIDGMLNGVIPPEQHEHYLRIVLSETKRLSRLVTTLLDISRIQAGERKFRMTNFDICEMARQILISFENRIEEKALDVQFTLDEDRMYVLADMDSIYQVLYNLCDNAVKFSKDGGKIALFVSENSGVITVSVFNEGEGIAEEDLVFVFDRFYKADKSRGIDKSGTGLGLYISKKIIEAHKEKIWVESESHVSCTFSFTLAKGENTGRRYQKI
ncbi:MAG: HAMP domain-containing histidine kinase [Clostridia bacterium]|nr:HAMP domain-containing histidine kinase [Clostridia bacterium]